MTVRAVAPQVWWVAGEAAEPDAVNRGLTANRLIVRHGARLWLLGSGPSPAAARALDCRLRRVVGQTVTDVINPWAQAQWTLGNAGFAPARVWAHADVAAVMRQQCPHCEARLRERLGAAAVDLGPAPIRLPSHEFQGDAGRLGPFEWQRLWRAPGQPVTVWRVRGQALWAAPGLVWGDGPPDLRDTDVVAMASTLANWVAALRGAAPDAAGPAWRVLSTQGAWLGPVAVQAQADYVGHLQQAVQHRLAEGGLETDPPLPLADMVRAAAGLDAVAVGWGGTAEPRHALNWQRSWRQAEAASFDAPAPMTPAR